MTTSQTTQTIPVDEEGNPVLLTEADFLDPEVEEWSDPALIDAFWRERRLEEQYTRETEAHIAQLWNER